MNASTEQTSYTSSDQDLHSGRGRGAEVPTDIPAAGWKDIAMRVCKEISNDRVLLVAAGVTFYLLLALGPLLAAFVSIYGLAFDTADISDHVQSLAGVIPGGAIDILNQQLERLTSAEDSALGIAFITSLLIALWSANAGMKALFEAMNVAYNEKEARGFFKLNAVTLSFTVATILSVMSLLILSTLFTSFQNQIGIALPNWLTTTVTALLALLGLIVFMACLYRFGPSRESPEWRWTSPGAIFAGLMIVIASALFSYYVLNFGTYNETYGSLGAVVGFLTWLWLVVIVLMISGELNAEMEHQTAHDTTSGPDEPMGQRGATMADELVNTQA